jgi:hypothetical protein
LVTVVEVCRIDWYRAYGKWAGKQWQ